MDPKREDPKTIEVDASHAQGQQFGDQNTQYNFFRGRREVSWPYRVGVVPALADCRQPRPVDDALANAVADSGSAVECLVLAGLGGVGKTQLAANLAHRLWQDKKIDLLIWVTATSRTSILTTYAQAAADITGVDDTGPEQAAARLLAWLASGDRGWLIVLDDLANPDDLIGLWPPDTTPRGRTVITTRRRDAALVAGRHVIDVALFTPQQSVAYLSAKLAGAPQLNDDPDGLATDLGHLPLALAQAVAYLTDRNLTCTAYRKRFGTRQLKDLTPLSLPDQHRAIIAATWQLSIDLADELTPAGVARPVLELAALLDPNGIPTGLFTSAPVTGYCAGRIEREVDADDTRDALHVLHQLSLATIDDTGGMLRVHALVQRAIREAIDSATAATSTRTAADALLTIWPAIERDTTLAQTLRANATVLRQQPGDALLDPDAHTLLFRATRSLGEAGLLRAAVAATERLLDDCLRVLGPDHPDTLTTRGNLAAWRGQAGDPAGAATATDQLLNDRLRVLGPDHPDTLTTRGNLAGWHGQAGDPAGAATAFQQLLDDCLRVLGPDHPHTLTTRGNLAGWRGEAGDPAGAATAFQQLLDDCLRVLGPDHPHTLTTRGNLVRWRGEAGDPAGAATATEQLLNDFLRVLGPDHPSTLTTRSSLVRWRGEAGDPAGAATATEQLLNDFLRILGPDHPSTLTTRGNLARWRGEAGDPAGAATATEQLLDDRLRVLGPDHPDTLTTRSNLASWRGQAGDPAGAATATEQLLNDFLRVLGPDHLDTLTTRSNLAGWRGQAGDPAGAATATEQLLNDFLRVLGPDHPNTLTARSNLAGWRGQAGDPAGAATALQQLLNDQLRVLGPNHPDTLTTRSNLAYWRSRASGRLASN